MSLSSLILSGLSIKSNGQALAIQTTGIPSTTVFSVNTSTSEVNMKGILSATTINSDNINCDNINLSSGTVAGLVTKVEHPTGTPAVRNLKREDSGLIISADDTLVAQVVYNLPPVATSSGVKFTVHVSTTGDLGNYVGISANAGFPPLVVHYFMIQKDPVVINNGSADVVYLTSGAKQGDRVEFVCDGIYWFVTIWVETTGSISFGP